MSPTGSERLQERLQEIGRRGGLRVWLFYRPGPGPRLMSWLRGRLTLLRNPHAEIRFGAGVYLGPGFSIDAPNGGTLVCGDGCEFRRGFRVELAGHGARVEIGARSIFTNDVLIQSASRVSIGVDCQVDQASLLVDGNHRVRLHGRAEVGEQPKPLTIGDRVTITTKCTVVADVGSDSMVGANSVVLQPVPAHSLAAGVPAEVLGHFGPRPQ